MIGKLIELAIGVVEYLANRPAKAAKKETGARDAQARWERIKADRALRDLEPGAKR